MTRTRTRPARVTVAQAADYIGEDFTAGSMTGETNPHRVETGRLAAEWVPFLRADMTAGELAYVVMSYGTPIAWSTTDGRRYIPAVRYSVTTSRHQNIVREEWNRFGSATITTTELAQVVAVETERAPAV